MNLPEAFCTRMQACLPQDHPAFLHAMTKEAPVHAFRLNTQKMPCAAFIPPPELGAQPIPYTTDGFYDTTDHIGHHPYHHAGILYAQDPGAMAALAGVPIPRGGRVLDVCAAPGGKSAQLAAGIGEDGVLVCNEYVPARCKLLVGNIERLGLPQTVVLNWDADALADAYPDCFDLVLVDAPCSGEGMFRKNDAAIAAWSEETVKQCAARQAGILQAGARAVRPGGYLVYATCTYAPEEDEMQVAALLAARPDMHLCPLSPALLPYTAPGLPQPGCPQDLSLSRRFYPHLAPGEGQFVALMQRDGAPATPCSVPTYPDTAEAPTRQEMQVLQAFAASTLIDGRFPRGRLARLHDRFCLLPDMPVPGHGVFAAGVQVGEIRKGNFFPHHQFFSAHGSAFTRQVRLTLQDPRLPAYLHGDVIPAPELPDGYAAVLLDGAPLGGGKVVSGMLKNLYPKGLRAASSTWP